MRRAVREIGVRVTHPESVRLGDNGSMTPAIHLTAVEARVIGCLLEKELTTPEQYPLSLNALVNACNQKNNRDPVMELTEKEVEHVLMDLTRNRLVVTETGFGNRVTKYRHRFCNTEFGSLKFAPQELAIVCELLLRDGQMPGELRSRASRLAAFKDVEELERVLDGLAGRDDGPFVAKLAREPGRRESRYVHLFREGAPATNIASVVAARHNVATPAIAADRVDPAVPDRTEPDRLARLESQVASLREEVAALRALVESVQAERSGESG